MAHVGMKNPYAVAIDPETGKYTGEIFKIGKAINFSGTPNNVDVKLWADDGVAESDKGVTDYSVSLNVDEVSLENQGKLLGHEYVPATETEPETLDIKNSDSAPYFGTGFYKRRRKNGVTSYTAVWLQKVQFASPAENGETKGETINFQTDTLEGSAFNNDAGSIIKKAVFSDEEKALAWIKNYGGQKSA